MPDPKLAVGQTLWMVRTRGWGAPQEVVVAKIGRKWATLAGNQGRVEIGTLWLDGDGYSPPGQCYLSREVWEAEKRADVAWNALFRSYRRRPPDLTADTIRQAAALLGIEIGEGDAG